MSSKSEKDLLLFLRPFLANEAKKGCRFFQTAGRTQLSKRLIVGKDKAAGKVLAGKSVIFTLLWFVGSKRETIAAAELAHFSSAALKGLNPAGHSGKRQFLRARFYRSTKIRFSLILLLRESCWGVPSPNPANAAYAA